MIMVSTGPTNEAIRAEEEPVGLASAVDRVGLNPVTLGSEICGDSLAWRTPN